jgi:hypothetical protein
MTKAGCPINGSGLYKIEKTDPPRRITVDELVALAEVFNVTVEDLLMPPEVAARRELVALFVDWNSARSAATAARDAESESWDRLKAYVEQHPEVGEVVEEAFTLWAEFYSKPENAPFQVTNAPLAAAHWMFELTGSPDWDKRVDALLDEKRAERKRGK